MYPEAIEQLIKSFSRLPSVGRRTAERFVFQLLHRGKGEVKKMVGALNRLEEEIKSCSVCWDFSDADPCATCTHPNRNNALICIVARPQDKRVILDSGVFDGQFHVLRGVARAEDPETLGTLKVTELFTRIKQGGVQEVILGLNPDIHGETTMMFLEARIKAYFPHITITRLARGLPIGSDIAYADDVTLSSAFQHRQKK